MNEREVALFLVNKLNGLLKVPGVRADIARLMETTIPASPDTCAQVELQKRTDPETGEYLLSVLGLLNGVVGAIPEGKRQGWGLIAMIFDNDSGECIGFGLTDTFDVEDCVPVTPGRPDKVEEPK